MKMALPPDLKDFLRLLNQNKVRYLLVGGYAVAMYGHVRATKDIDFWVAIDENNTANIQETLKQFGFPEAAKVFRLESGEFFRLGYPPVRIELLSKISGVEFETCYTNKQVMQVEDIEVSVIDLADLRKNKKASGRLQDLADLERLPETLDK